MSQEGNTLTIQVNPKIYREFSFHKILDFDEDFDTLFKIIIMPMLRCTIKGKQDSSLMLFGISDYIIQLVGAYTNFFKNNNILTSTLAFIFENILKYHISSILISLFQVYNSKINDLLSNEFKKISSRFANTYKEAIQLLLNGFKKLSSSSQSIQTLFINIELNFHPNFNSPNPKGSILSFIVIFDEKSIKAEETIYDILKKYLGIIEKKCEKGALNFEKQHLLCTLLRQNIENDNLINFLQCIDPLQNHNPTLFSKVFKILELCKDRKSVV